MNIVIIGHTVGVRFCIEAMRESPHRITAIFTHERSLHTNDLRIFEKRKEQFGEYAYDVFNVPSDFGIPVVEYKDLASEADRMAIHSFNPDLIVTVGCRDILKKEFIESFQYVINLHPFYLPYFRGAGIDSWMLLQGYAGTQQQATCHFINPKIDAGNIICTEPYFIPLDATPLDIFKVRISKLGLLLVRAIKLLEEGTQGTGQDNLQSRYYPRLFTPRDGKIDITSWSGSEIVRFVQAFSYPYDGAFFHYEGKTIHVLKASFTEQEGIHPFSYGVIFSKTEKELSVYCRRGVLTLSQIEFEDSSMNPSKIKLGKFLK
ncbi:MAG: hypothetical protein IT223_06630 [Crocinitomicaceae bacterium]|nr:hypothetical protein [Crocinitomicaceae bacterium]